MLTEAQKVDMASQFLHLYETGKRDEALLFLRETENWVIYPRLPSWAFDDEQISQVAVGRHSYLSSHMSQRLQRAIRFFENVFNQFSPSAKIALATGRDAFFMLAYARALHGYPKAATKSDVAAIFPDQDIEIEFSIAQQLIDEVRNWRQWPLREKQECSRHLIEQVPGLASFSYEYAYYWGHRKMADDARSNFLL